MQGLIEIIKILKNKGRIEILFKWEGKLNKYFREEKFYCEYNENIEEVPDGIAVIPFLGDILPLVWLTDSKLMINELDKNYYECLSKVKNAYSNMYPGVDFIGKVEVKKIVDYSYTTKEKVCQLFSGGVDSMSTYLSIKKMNPELVTIWGTDMPVNNYSGWSKVEKYVKDFGENNENKNIIIKSNFRKIYSSHKLTKDFMEKLKVNWWLGVQHGIALISLLAPYIYKNKIKTLYIPGSYNIYDKNVKCASYPTIDEAIKYGSINIIHEGFEYTRQDKIFLIQKYLKETNDKNIKLRVCWEGDSGENCNHCEKCLGTIIGLYLVGIDPNNLGFNIKKEKIKEIFFLKDIEVDVEDWRSFQEFLLKNKQKFKNESWINWLIEFDLKENNRKVMLKKKNKFYKIKSRIRSILKKWGKDVI